LLLSFILITACAKPEPNFDLNGADPEPSSSEPADYKDSTMVKVVFANSKIILSDISERLEKVKKRYWDTNDDDEWDEEFQDQDFIEVSFEGEGFHKIVFCANDPENCTTKWVYVRPALIDEDDQRPQFFISERNIQIEKRSYELSISTENIFSEEEVRVLIGGEERPFEFNPETQEITIPIKYIGRGRETLVEIEANTPEGIASESISITRIKIEDEEDNQKDSKRKKGGVKKENEDKTDQEEKREEKIEPQKKVAPPMPAPTVQIIDPKDNIKTQAGTYELKVRTRNLPGKMALTIKQNGKGVTDFKFVPNERAWVAMLSLDDGKNTIEVIGRNSSGEGRDKVAIEYYVEEELENNGTAGLEGSKYELACLQPASEQYTFTVSPNQAVELFSFTLASDICGGLEVTMSSTEGSKKAKLALTKGKNQISLQDLRARLKPGIKYTFSCSTIAGFGTCSAEKTPQMLDASDCGNQPLTKPELDVDYQGKSIIYDLKYFH